MSHYDEEQKNEMEVLKSIYPEELEILSETNPIIFTVTLKPDIYSRENYQNVGITLKFSIPENYPDEIVNFECIPEGEIEDVSVEELTELLNETASQNIGNVMIFTLCSCAADWLEDTSRNFQSRIDEEKRILENELDMARQKEETPQFFGTALTLENFLEWREKFEQEVKAIEEMKHLNLKSDSKKKLTGRQIFERDESMITSDVNFLEDDDIDVDVNVNIDEALFEDDLEQDL
eukprot:Sdes_comp20187_c2_seq2m13462